MTAFISVHPGGSAVLLRHAGTDATASFDAVHPTEILDEYVGSVRVMGSLLAEQASNSAELEDASSESRLQQASNGEDPGDMVPVKHMLSLGEMETSAIRQLSPKALSYYASGTDDELTMRHNSSIFKQMLLRPRVFVDCRTCDLSTTILGEKVGLPIFISPAAMAKLAHPSGERGIAAACSSFNALQIISKNASISVPSIVAAGKGAVYAWQLYVLKDIAATERTLARIRAIPQVKFIVWGTEGGLTWHKTLEWLSTQTSLPIVLKGIQCHEDAYAATKFPSVKGIIVSNHGGRALGTAPTPVQVLLEMRKFCPEVFSKVEVMMDGGIHRGTDVVKALALGAKAVGIGRAALYGLALAGEEGVTRTLQSTQPTLEVTHHGKTNG
ncbi:hypothetical protein JDV02_004680 [Purpureocillium takamizusanense]|uniref:FMN hydroxy acid dehydrogenase domain-containing protein n=1 Tax=Purpureocillium takamizusanense TaxID=2060973 RepID=A0A9Q8VB12_9HYPO|nr:uncharacterized protein JDV02_004680 [Purpureocillium takamizusanense]UNI18409.1 hypothetical protein JDV02_004680 [Purpureocillium takamizusanense]